MPLLTLLIYIVIVVLLVYLAVWVLGKLAPEHPPIVDNILWVVCVLIIVLMLLQAFGVMGSGPRVPQLG
jgi:hypothetical protein